MFGRKRIKDAGKTSRELGRSIKEEREKKSIQENLKSLRQERENLEAQFQNEVEMMKIKNDPLMKNWKKYLFHLPKLMFQFVW